MPNIPKYSRSFSLDVCQLRPPTNNLPGAVSAFGVDLPDDELPPLDNAWLLLELVLVFVLFTFCTILLLLLPLHSVAALTGIKALCKSCSTEFASMTPLEKEREKITMIDFFFRFYRRGGKCWGWRFVAEVAENVWNVRGFWRITSHGESSGTWVDSTWGDLEKKIELKSWKDV